MLDGSRNVHAVGRLDQAVSSKPWFAMFAERCGRTGIGETMVKTNSKEVLVALVNHDRDPEASFGIADDVSRGRCVYGSRSVSHRYADCVKRNSRHFSSWTEPHFESHCSEERLGNVDQLVSRRYVVPVATFPEEAVLYRYSLQ